jgi:two-component system phosphate regulon response regulator PhoB
MTGTNTVLFTSQNVKLFHELELQCPDLALIVIGSKIPPLDAAGNIWCFVDFLLPEMSGLEVCRRLRADPATQRACITMVFDSMDKELIVRALHAGADDYVVGQLFAEDVLKRFEHGPVAHPLEAKDGNIILGDIVIEPGAYRVKYCGQRVNLAPNEFQLLLHFAKSPDRVFSRDDLIQSLGKPSELIESRTVDVWVGRLRQAFKKVGAPEVVRTVRPIGYVFEIPGS